LALPEAGPREWCEGYETQEAILVAAGVPVELARRHSFRRPLVHAPNAIDLARTFQRAVPEIARIMFHAGHAVSLDRLEEIAAGFSLTDRWQRWALETLEVDMVEVRRSLAERILQEAEGEEAEEAVEAFLTRHRASVERLNSFVQGLGSEQPEHLAPLMIGVGQLRSLTG
jgi:NAD-specific glutamate dehydrogenase